MHQRTKYILQVLVAACLTLFTGCISQKTTEGLGATVEAAARPIFEPSFEIAHGANEFQQTRKRWPKDYEELSNFLMQSDDKTLRQLQAVQFHHIHFDELPDGRLRINADYSVNGNYTAGSGASVHINAPSISFSLELKAAPDSPTLEPKAAAHWNN